MRMLAEGYTLTTAETYYASVHAAHAFGDGRFAAALEARGMRLARTLAWSSYSHLDNPRGGTDTGFAFEVTGNKPFSETAADIGSCVMAVGVDPQAVSIAALSEEQIAGIQSDPLHYGPTLTGGGGITAAVGAAVKPLVDAGKGIAAVPVYLAIAGAFALAIYLTRGA